jgi:hypothetical protein
MPRMMPRRMQRMPSLAPDTDLPDHDCGELSAFFKERAKERGEMK